MKRSTQRNIVALFVGLLFGAGLALSGMTRPEKVIAFLDVGGAWDPSLMFVMAGAIGVHFLAYRLIRKRSAPLLEQEFAVPQGSRIDPKLVAGAALFGVGWGLAGYCPGPGITSLAVGSQSALVFVGTMLLGLLVASVKKRQPGS